MNEKKTPNQKRLEEVEALIAQGEKEVAAVEQSEAYRDALRAAREALKDSEDAYREAGAARDVVCHKVLIACRVSAPEWSEKRSQAAHWNADLLAAVEKIAGVPFALRRGLAQAGRVTLPEADPVLSVLLHIEAETLRAHPDYRRAHAARDAAYEKLEAARCHLYDVEARVSRLRREKVDRYEYERRDLCDKIAKYEEKKSEDRAADKAAKARTIEARRALLDIAAGKTKISW